MNFKQVQAIDRIISLRNPNAKLVVQYNDQIISGDFSTPESRAKLTKDFGEDQSFANDAVKKFGTSSTYIPDGPFSVESLEKIINFVNTFESNKESYYPAIYNVHLLDNKIDLPFLRLEPDSSFEIISIIQGAD